MAYDLAEVGVNVVIWYNRDRHAVARLSMPGKSGLLMVAATVKVSFTVYHVRAGPLSNKVI